MANRSTVESYTAAELSLSEEQSLGWAIVNDNCHASREKMTLANLRLVSSVACRYAGRGVPLGELLERGKIGLVRAVEHYDPAKGARFSTLASWWIKQSIKHGFKTASDQGIACRREREEVRKVEAAPRGRSKSIHGEGAVL